MSDLLDRFGNIDVYWFDQLLKGRVSAEDRVLDAGCGGGRNLVYLLQSGYDVFGIDADERAISAMCQWSEDLPEGSWDKDLQRFVVGDLASLPWSDGWFDVVICNAVLHFAPTLETFDSWLAQLWRVLRPSGMLFVRLASSNRYRIKSDSSG